MDAARMLKTLAFAVGLCILTVGAIGILAPPVMLGFARHFLTTGASGFSAITVIRVAFGIVLILVAPASRAPRGLRVLGYAIVILGIVTGLASLVAMDRARGSIEWWLRQGQGVVRLTGLPLVALGGFVAYACAPVRRAA
jgi:hypothetical protein